MSDAPMFDGQPLSKREVLIAREAFRKGRAHQCLAPHEAYPLPKVTRPRVVRDPLGTNYGPASGHVGSLYWSVKDGRLIPVTKDGAFIPEWEEDQTRDSYPTASRVALWADLLAHPTEEVSDE